MKKYILLIAFIPFCFALIVAQNCERSTAQQDINTGRAQITHSPNGQMWWDETGAGRFLIDDPQLSDEPASVAFLSEIWIGGKTPNGTIKVSHGQKYRPGPLDNDGMISANTCKNFDKIWEVTAAHLAIFRSDYLDNGSIDEPIPPSIKEWPGRNNPFSSMANGFDLPDGRDLAPFFDVNSDNIYNPQDGDYPDIRGAKAALWWIFNDQGPSFISTEVKADIAVLAYTFDSDNVSSNTTIFYEIEITNKGTQALDEFVFSFWVDPDLGCYNDDSFGCSPENNLAFVYNTDDHDGYLPDNNCTGVPTFNKGIPFFGVKLLEGVKDADDIDLGMTSFSYYNNAGVGGPWDPETIDPTNNQEFFNFMNGFWKDGSAMTTGGNGLNPGSSDNTPFAFPGDPSNADEWSECTATLPQGDRRFMLSSGGITLNPNQKTKVAISAIVTRAVENPCPELAPLLQAAEESQDAFDARLTNIKNQNLNTRIKIFPNPTNDWITINPPNKEKIVALKVLTLNSHLIDEVDGINANHYQLELSQHAAGIYLLKIETSSGKHGIERIIKF